MADLLDSERRQLSLQATVDIYVDGEWQRAAEVRPRNPSLGTASPSTFDYDFRYLDRQEAWVNAKDRHAVSCRYPLRYNPVEEPHWPAFLLDLVPSGAARRHWEQELGLRNTESSDWAILLAGAGFPPGNLRIANALLGVTLPEHAGFVRSDILERREHFIEYARACGAPVSGSTGAGGDSPKFLLREDADGRWHADGALADARTKRCWLVKFPRTPDATDRLILRTEANYHAVATRFGVRTFKQMLWENNCLFVPRFDRVVTAGRVDCLGLESLCSLAGVAEFSARIPKEKLAASLAACATDPRAELFEFVARDILDVALGNTDNHARNTSVLKTDDGKIALAPLYDFAPMILDERGIARVCRWKDGADYPDWNAVATFLETLGLDPTETRRWMQSMAQRVSALPSTMRDCGVVETVVERCASRIELVAQHLEQVTS